jgi:tol-pal system protein YbgF
VKFYDTRHLFTVLSTLALGACATTPEVDPVAVKLDDIDARLTRVEAVVNNQSLVDLSRRSDALEQQLRQLRGSGEESQNSAEQLRKQQRDLYADLDRRLVAIEAAGKAPTTAAGVSAAAGANAAPVPGTAAGADQTSYTRALDTLKAGDYSSAVKQLQGFATAFPDSSLLDNAQYWLGEAYYVLRDYSAAAAAFRSVSERWPNSRKAGDALLKLGFTQYELQQPAAARTTLQQVMARFPNTEAARLAAERLAKLRAESR